LKDYTDYMDKTEREENTKIIDNEKASAAREDIQGSQQN
jgi:hypothetical protein